MPTKVLISKFI